MKKATHHVVRKDVSHFQQIVNIGPKMENDFRELGFEKPADLIGQDPWKMFCKIAKLHGVMHDPCVLDCYLSAVDFMNGKPPKKWWSYTSKRKRDYTEAIDKLRAKFEA